MKFSYGALFIKILLLFFLYYITALLGLRLDAVSGFAALFWLPTGISLAMLLIFGYKLWPAIVLGAFLANVTNGAPLFVGVGIAVGNTLEALVGAYFLKRFGKFHNNLERLSDVLWLLVVAAVFSTMISATLGVVSLSVGGVLTSSFADAWLAWWIGDMLSNVIIAPFLLVWNKVSIDAFKQRSVPEYILLVVLVVCVGMFVFRGMFGIALPNSQLTYIVFPPIIWAALRFGQRETVTAVFMLSLIAIVNTVQGYGPFVREQLHESLFLLQTFMGVIATTAMLLAAAVSERRVLEARKDEFLSIASHELKTPLTTIKAYAQILQKRLESQKDKEKTYFVTSINRQADILAKLINGLMDVSKIESGKFEFRKSRINLDEVITNTIRDFQYTTNTHTLIKKGKSVQSILADPDRIEQVLTNLLANAIKYSPGKKQVVIQVKRQKEQVIVSVQDFGIGIPDDKQHMIFNRFYQVKEKEKKPPGFGLGLYIASEIIKMHAGTMWVESTVGKGTTFYFSLGRNSYGKPF